MNTAVKYSNLVERAEKVKGLEANGWRMLHDNFDKNWVAGSEPHGIIIFTNEPTPEPPPIVDLAGELNDLKRRVVTLESKV